MSDTTSSNDVLAQISILLKDTTHPGNIGAAARAMKTMGLRHLVLVGARTLVDATSRAMATGASDILAAARNVNTLPDAIADCTHIFAFTARRRQHAPPALLPDDAAQKAVAICQQGGRVGFLFGGERSGLENEDIQCAHYTVEIPTCASYHSLNLAQAVQVASYELHRAAANPNAAEAVRDYPTAADLQGMLTHWQEALACLGLPKNKNDGLLLTRLQVLLNRAQLDASEVRLLRGICREIIRHHQS